MHRYLVEVPHEAGNLACALVVRTFLDTGSNHISESLSRITMSSNN